MLNKRRSSLLSARQIESYDKVHWIFDRYVDCFDNLQNDIIDEHFTDKEINILCKVISDYIKEF